MFSYNTEFDIAKYIAITEDIADKFFNESGEYVPHFGKLNMMGLFYNNCIDKATIPEGYPTEVGNLNELSPIVADANFVSAFNEALVCDYVRTDFANAYIDALEMIDDRKASIGRILNAANIGIKNIVSELENNLSPEMAENIKKIVASIDDGNDLAEAIVREYGKMAFKE